jgi:hypothetical protein
MVQYGILIFNKFIIAGDTIYNANSRKKKRY